MPPIFLTNYCMYHIFFDCMITGDSPLIVTQTRYTDVDSFVLNCFVMLVCVLFVYMAVYMISLYALTWLVTEYARGRLPSVSEGVRPIT